MRRVAVAVALLVLGAALIGSSFVETSRDADYVARNGVAVVGEIVELAGSEVTIDFSLDQERMQAVAHPTDAALLEVGSFVMISVLRDDTSRIVIQGTTESQSAATAGLLIVGGLLVIAGFGMILLRAVATPVAGRFPRFSWTRERHGGA